MARRFLLAHATGDAYAAIDISEYYNAIITDFTPVMRMNESIGLHRMPPIIFMA